MVKIKSCSMFLQEEEGALWKILKAVFRII